MSFAKPNHIIQAKSIQNSKAELIMQHKNMQTTKTYVTCTTCSSHLYVQRIQITDINIHFACQDPMQHRPALLQEGYKTHSFLLIL